MRKFLLLLLVSSLFSACAHKDKGFDELTPEETAELNRHLARRDECMVQEAARMDDRKSDIGQITDLVFWKCQEHFRQINSLLYDKFKVSLSSSWAYKTRMEENSKKEIGEAIITNRKRHVEGDGTETQVRGVVPAMPVRMPAPQDQTPMHTEIEATSLPPQPQRAMRLPVAPVQQESLQDSTQAEPPMPAMQQPAPAAPRSSVNGW